MNELEQTQPLLADLATGLWRLRQRFLDPDTGAVLKEQHRLLRDVEAMLQRLQEASIEIQDHTGAAYDPTLSLHVAAFQPMPGLTQDRVLETLKPTVYHGQQRIQIGEVI